MLSYACYLIETDKNENLALEKAIYLESVTESYSMLYIIQSLKDFVMSAQKEMSDEMYTDSLRFEQLMNKRLEEKLYQMMLKATQSVFDLYQMLDEEGLLMKRIEFQLRKVAGYKMKLESLWKSNYITFNKNPEVMDKIVFLFKYIYDKETIGHINLDSLKDVKASELKHDKLKMFNKDQSLSSFSDPALLVRITDSDFIIEDVNMSLLRLVGYLRKDLVSRPL